MARAGKFCLVSSCKISHFGINPVSGGRPPNASRASIAVIVAIGVFAHFVDRVLIFVADRVISVKNAVDVIVIYSSRFSRASVLEYWIMITIHPRCAIDE